MTVSRQGPAAVADRWAALKLNSRREMVSLAMSNPLCLVAVQGHEPPVARALQWPTTLLRFSTSSSVLNTNTFTPAAAAVSDTSFPAHTSARFASAACSQCWS